MTIGAQWSQDCTPTAESTLWIVDSYLDLLFLLQGRQLAEANRKLSAIIIMATNMRIHTPVMVSAKDTLQFDILSSL